MLSQRTYKTNLAYETTVNDPRFQGEEVFKDFNPGQKGQATFHLKAMPNLRVQITVNGFIKMLGGTRESDEPILKYIEQYVTTNDGQKFRWRFNKETKGEKELWIEAKQARRIEVFQYLEALKSRYVGLYTVEISSGKSVQSLKAEFDQLTHELKELGATLEQLKLPPTSEEVVQQFAKMLRRNSKDRT